MKSWFFVVLILAIAGLTGCGHESSSMDAASPAASSPMSADLFAGTDKAAAVDQKAEQAADGGGSTPPLRRRLMPT